MKLLKKIIRLPKKYTEQNIFYSFLQFECPLKSCIRIIWPDTPAKKMTYPPWFKMGEMAEKESERQ
jgi:hypothetical protein